MDDVELAEWLLANAGPIIRFRTIVDILHSQDVGQVGDALDKLLATPVIGLWLGRLQEFNPGQLWCRMPSCFSNTIGKLVQLGMRAGLQPFDSIALPPRVWLTEMAEREDSGDINVTREMYIVASLLALAGYSETMYVQRIMIHRLKAVHDIISSHGLMRNGQVVVSLLDVVAFAHTAPIMGGRRERGRVEEVVQLAISEGEGRVIPAADGHLAPLLVALESLVKYKSIRESKWFTRVMQRCEKWRTPQGTYDFTVANLPERREGHWLHGDFMEFDDRREVPRATECESTFRMLFLRSVV